MLVVRNEQLAAMAAATQQRWVVTATERLRVSYADRCRELGAERLQEFCSERVALAVHLGLVLPGAMLDYVTRAFEATQLHDASAKPRISGLTLPAADVQG